MKRIAIAVALLLVVWTPAAQADCQFECKSYPGGDKFCWEWLSGKPKAAWVTCRVESLCYWGIDGTVWCTIRCEGSRCYIA